MDIARRHASRGPVVRGGGTAEPDSSRMRFHATHYAHPWFNPLAEPHPASSRSERNHCVRPRPNSPSPRLRPCPDCAHGGATASLRLTTQPPGSPPSCHARVAAEPEPHQLDRKNFRARTANEPDNDHANTPTATQCGRLFHLSFGLAECAADEDLSGGKATRARSPPAMLQVRAAGLCGVFSWSLPRVQCGQESAIPLPNRRGV